MTHTQQTFEADTRARARALHDAATCYVPAQTERDDADRLPGWLAVPIVLALCGACWAAIGLAIWRAVH